ncbi:MAG: hypothetical protein CMM49_08655 [Rhodospirillaceae bacterium]|nr:hypothetical protein [Rhodospirillaceae bacterium]|tara:strand:- start:6233 stop:6424 length:192 start_codon:yes stop_codon:yes gene_type:complete
MIFTASLIFVSEGKLELSSKDGNVKILELSTAKIITRIAKIRGNHFIFLPLVEKHYNKHKYED